MGRRARAVVITEDERRILEGYARRFTSAQFLAKRSSIVLALALADGKAGKAVACEQRTSPVTVCFGGADSSRIGSVA